MARVRRSASRAEATVLDRVELLAGRAFFRAAVLTQLAAQLNDDAGLRRSAADFRAALDGRVAALDSPASVDAVSFACEATCRSAVWRRHGEILARRWQLWRRPPLSPAAVGCLAATPPAATTAARTARRAGSCWPETCGGSYTPGAEAGRVERCARWFMIRVVHSSRSRCATIHPIDRQEADDR